MKKRADDNGWLRVGLLLRNVKIFPEREEKITRAFDSLGFHNRSQKKKNTTRQKSTKKSSPRARGRLGTQTQHQPHHAGTQARAREREREREREEEEEEEEERAFSFVLLRFFANLLEEREREKRS